MSIRLHGSQVLPSAENRSGLPDEIENLQHSHCELDQVYHVLIRCLSSFALLDNGFKLSITSAYPYSLLPVAGLMKTERPLDISVFYCTLESLSESTACRKLNGFTAQRHISGPEYRLLCEKLTSLTSFSSRPMHTCCHAPPRLFSST